MEQIEVSGIKVDVIRKNIKNIHLTVYPPEGRIKVSVPSKVDNEALRLFIVSKIGWIRKKLADFRRQERQSYREYSSGENHYFKGQRYILNVISQKAPKANKVKIRNNKFIDLYVRDKSNIVSKKRILNEWYRTKMYAVLPEIFKKWELELNVDVKEWGVRIMKTKWGTCNTEAKRIWLNLDLIKKPPHCLEYIIVHEMMHLIERTHSEKFNLLMDKYYPNWQTVRKELNEFVL